MQIHYSNKIFRYITKLTIVSIFSVYWLLTIIFCSPQNFIKIKLLHPLSNFGLLFPQQWSFFAPPPTYNNRLYFSYYTNDSLLLNSVEVIKPILDKKQSNAPFNFDDQLIDYSINSTIILVNEILVQQKNIFQTKFKDSTELVCSEMAKKEIARLANNFDEVRTLVNYSKIVLQKVNYNQIPKYVKITITQIAIPKFENRQTLLQENLSDKQESLLFDSELLLL